MGHPLRTKVDRDVIERWSREVRGINVDPSRRLMLAVLQEAVLTLIDVPPKPSLQRRRMIEEAEDWLASPSIDNPFAFASICEALHLDAGCLREAISNWRRAH